MFSEIKHFLIIFLIVELRKIQRVLYDVIILFYNIR